MVEKNAVIRIRLHDLIGILEAKEYVEVYVEGQDAPINKGKVYELLADKKFKEQYGERFVTGLISFPITTSILIGKES